MFDQICNTVLKGYSPWEVISFLIIVFAALVIDLRAHGKDEPISLKNATVWSIIWVAVSFGFAAFIMQEHGIEKASLFLSGYVLEKSLSVDNLFVFMAIFASFGIKDELQHRILYFGILGAIILRFIFVSLGSSLLYLDEIVAHFFGWEELSLPLGPLASVFGMTQIPISLDKIIFSLFGCLVLYSAYTMFLQVRCEETGECDDIDYTHHRVVRWVSKIVPVHNRLDGHKFFTRQNAKLMATPLLLVLCVVEVSDVMFAFDSVPVVIAITQEPFLVYTSNIFAILGLRSMFFLLSAAKRYLCHLEKAVIGILVFIGVKMLLGVTESYHNIHITANMSLVVVLIGLLIGIAASILMPEKEEAGVAGGN